MKRKAFSVFIVLSLAFSMFAFTGCGESGGEDEVFHFNVSFMNPEPAAAGIVEALDRIQEASNGRITMTYYFSWALTSVATIIDDFNSGIVDIGVHSFENDTFFPYANLITNTPFLGMPSIHEAARIFAEMYEDYPVLAEEFARNGIVFWTLQPFPSTQLYTRSDFEIRMPSDLAGRRIITNLPMLQEFLSNNGAAGVSAPVTDISTMINTGVADGVMQHPGVMLAFGVLDFLEGATFYGPGGILSAMGSISFSEQAWNRLPADLQQLFIDEADNVREAMASLQYVVNMPVNDRLIEQVPVQQLSDAEIQAWLDDFAPIIDAHVETMIGRGHTEARNILDSVRARIAAR